MDREGGGKCGTLLLIKVMHITRDTHIDTTAQKRVHALSDVILLLTLITLVILPVCANTGLELH